MEGIGVEEVIATAQVGIVILVLFLVYAISWTFKRKKRSLSVQVESIKASCDAMSEFSTI